MQRPGLDLLERLQLDLEVDEPVHRVSAGGAPATHLSGARADRGVEVDAARVERHRLATLERAEQQPIDDRRGRAVGLAQRLEPRRVERRRSPLEVGADLLAHRDQRPA